jgi:hypothetical protein
VYPSRINNAGDEIPRELEIHGAGCRVACE